ncbi:MAG: glycosyl hydrolase family 18 protein [bacterium]
MVILKRYFFFAVALFILVVPSLSLAAVAPSGLSYSTWLAYWKKDASVADILPHLNSFVEISPFSYTVRSDGTLADTALIDQSPWTGLFTAASSSGVKIIPTVAWSDSASIYNVLSSTKLRNSHVQQIMSVVTSHNFAGIDIDYENKTLATKAGFSAFLKQLGTALHAKKKIMACSIEARTPLSSRFVNIPKTTSYVNDFSVINQYCDEVRIMAYDQYNVDIVLNKSKGGGLNYYAPISDTDWVKKVIMETLGTINRKKIVLAVATYARDYTVVQNGNSYSYTNPKSIAYNDAMALAQSKSLVPTRNSAGELGFAYMVASSTAPSVLHYVSISDAGSISDKIRLARAYSLKGVAVFKIDGSEDPQIWNILN